MTEYTRNDPQPGDEIQGSWWPAAAAFVLGSAYVAKKKAEAKAAAPAQPAERVLAAQTVQVPADYFTGRAVSSGANAFYAVMTAISALWIITTVGRVLGDTAEGLLTVAIAAVPIYFIYRTWRGEGLWAVATALFLADVFLF